MNRKFTQCPICGGELKSGLLRSSRLLYWSAGEERGLYAHVKGGGDIVPPGASRMMGSDCPSWYCETCELILTPAKEEEPL